jgi:hypothetical protein
VVEELLMTSSHSPEFAGQGKGEHEVRDVQEQILLLFQPLLCLTILALGTVAVAAGMVLV